MIDIRRPYRRASLTALLLALVCCTPTPCASAYAAGREAARTGVAGTWEIVDHPLDDGSNYHIYLDLQQSATSVTGRVSYPWGYLKVASGVVNDNHFQLYDDAQKLIAEGERAGAALKLHLAVGKQAGLARVAMLVPAEPLPVKLPYPALHAVASIGTSATPPMGWNSWNKFEEKIDDPTIRAIADAMAANGMRDAGYTYVNIDDTWQGPRDAQGNITANRKFPDMKALADYVHARGLKLGIYSSPGPLTCAGYPGSLGHEEQDARTYASWGIDYLKYDWCSAKKIYRPEEMHAVYQKMGDALARSGRPILFSLCQYGEADVWAWGPSVGASLWRTTDDIHDNWPSMSGIGFSQSRLAPYAAPGHWNDPDMLEVGNGQMTAEEYRTHFSLWSLLAAPLLAGNDVAHMDASTRSILLNKEVIAIDQDPEGKEATLLQRNGEQEIWTKPLADGSVAVGLFNRGGTAASIGVEGKSLGLAGTAHGRDLWRHADIAVTGDRYAAEVPAHGVVLLRLRQQAAVAQDGGSGTKRQLATNR